MTIKRATTSRAQVKKRMLEYLAGTVAPAVGAIALSGCSAAEGVPTLTW